MTESERKAREAVVRAALRSHRLRVKLGSFVAMLENTQGRILLDACDRACARLAALEKRRKGKS